MDDALDTLTREIHSPGERTYCLYCLLHGATNYEEMNARLGCLDAAGKEYYRRVVSPYEDTKIEDNGDIDLQYTPGFASAGYEQAPSTI